jgi:hypothetical protein
MTQTIECNACKMYIDRNLLEVCDGCLAAFCKNCSSKSGEHRTFVITSCCDSKTCVACSQVQCDVCGEMNCAACVYGGCQFERNCQISCCYDCWYQCESCNLAGCGEHYDLDLGMCQKCISVSTDRKIA